MYDQMRKRRRIRNWKVPARIVHEDDPSETLTNSIAVIYAMLCNSSYVRNSDFILKCMGCSGKGQVVGSCLDAFGLPACFKTIEPARINRPTPFVKQLANVYLSTLYHRSYDADQEKEAINEAKANADEAASSLTKGIWMVQPIDRTLWIHEQSKLPQIGGGAMKGAVELISIKYFLRQATRRHGQQYNNAASMLVKLHNSVGLPQEVLEEIRSELNDVLGIIDDDAFTKGCLRKNHPYRTKGYP